MVQGIAEKDAVIVGGGPAGLAAGIALRRKGLSVLIVERAQPPIDKVCGEGLMPDGIAALAGLGVTIPPGLAIPFRGIRFIERGTSAEAPFPRGYGLGIRRTTLHRVLLQHAREAGAEILWDSKVERLTRDGIEVDGHGVSCKWIVGADGQNSFVRRWAGLSRVSFEQIRFSQRRHFAVKPWTDFVEVYWGDNFQVVVTPVGSALICTALVSRNPQLRLGEAIASLPALSDRLADAVPTTGEKGAVSVLRKMQSVCRGHIALVGDASGSVESLTGKGLCLAFEQVTALSQAIANHDLTRYAIAHRGISRAANVMSRLLLAMDRHAALRKRVVQALAARPPAFSSLLADHAAGGSSASVGIGALLGLGWQALTSPS